MGSPSLCLASLSLSPPLHSQSFLHCGWLRGSHFFCCTFQEACRTASRLPRQSCIADLVFAPSPLQKQARRPRPGRTMYRRVLTYAKLRLLGGSVQHRPVGLSSFLPPP